MKDKETLNEGKPHISENFDELKMFEGLEVDEEAGRAAIAEARRLHKRRKIFKAAALTACLLLVVVVTWSVLTGSGDEHSGITDDFESEKSWEVEEPEVHFSINEEDIALFKSISEDMLVPDYIPEDYSFQSVRLAQHSTGSSIGYVYANEEGEELLINARISDDGFGSSLTMYGVYDIVETAWGDVYLDYGPIEDRRGFTKIYQDNTLIVVSAPGYTSEEELLTILEGLLT